MKTTFARIQVQLGAKIKSGVIRFYASFILNRKQILRYSPRLSLASGIQLPPASSECGRDSYAVPRFLLHS